MAIAGRIAGSAAAPESAADGAARRALRLGHGSALVRLLASDPEERATLVLEAAADEDGAGGEDRAPWLIWLAAECGVEAALAADVLARFEEERRSERARTQAAVLAELAAGGRPEARELVYRRFCRQDLDDPEALTPALLRIDGLEGFVFAAEVFGQRLEREPGFEVAGSLQREACARFGEGAVARRIERRVQRGTPMIHYRNALASPGADPPDAMAPRMEETPVELDAVAAFDATPSGAARATLLARLPDDDAGNQRAAEGLCDADSRVRAAARRRLPTLQAEALGNEDHVLAGGMLSVQVRRFAIDQTLSSQHEAVIAACLAAAGTAEEDGPPETIRMLRRTPRRLRLALFGELAPEGGEPPTADALELIDLLSGLTPAGAHVRAFVPGRGRETCFVCLETGRPAGAVLRVS